MGSPSARHSSWRRRMWLRVAAWWGGFAALVVLERVFVAQPVLHRFPENPPGLGRVCSGDGHQVESIEIEAGRDRVVVKKDGAHWQRGAQAVPADLVVALFESLATASHWPEVATGAERDRDFGLDPPVALVQLRALGGELVCQLVFGAPNAVGTGRYVRMNNRREVFLAGVQLWYYLELLAGRPLDKRV